MAQGSIIKRQGKSGVTYAIRFRDQTGKRHYKVIGPRKGDAKRALAQVMTQVNKGEWRSLPDISFTELAGKWLGLKKTQVRPKTYQVYEQYLKLRLIPYFGRHRLKGITQEAVEKFAAHLSGDERLAPDTAGKTITILKSVLFKGVQWGYLSQNPAQHVKKPKVPKYKMDFLVPEEIKILIDATDSSYRCLIMTACLTGARLGEILGLKWGDIDFESERVFIRRTLQQGKFYESKSATSRRAVVVAPLLIQALKQHQHNMERHCKTW